MQEEFVTYKQALSLKELGFDEPCIAIYEKGMLVYISQYEYNNLLIESLVSYKNSEISTWDNNELYQQPLYSAPLKQQVFKWFRKEHNSYPEINLHDREDVETWRYTISILGYYDLAYNQNVGKEPYYKPYEETESACIDKLIDIVKNKTND